VVRWLPCGGLALLLGDGCTLAQPVVPRAHASVAYAGLAGFPQLLTYLSPTLVVGFSFSQKGNTVLKLQKPITAFVIGAGGGLVVSGLLYGRMLVTLTGILCVLVGSLEWYR